MTELSRQPLDALLAAFESGITIEEIERRYHAGTLDPTQVAAAVEVFLRAERMTGHDYGLRAEDLPPGRVDPGSQRSEFVGSMRGQFELPDDFNDPDPEIERMFGMR